MGADKQMEIQSLKLTNFRGIEQAELALDGKSAVIYGINGMGKSTVLQACSILFFRILNMLTESDLGSDGKVKIEDSDIKIGAQTARISMQLNIDHTIYPYFRSAESNGKRIHLVGEAKRIVEQFRRLYVGQYMVLEEEETDESDRESTRELVFNESNMPIYASYGVNRYVSDRRNKVLKKDIKLAGKLEALRDVFDPTINFQLFFEWFRGRQEYENSKRVEKESFKDAQLSAVREAILKIMNGWDINHIMHDFMHTDILNEETKKLIDEIYNCIENENFDQAEELVDQLVKITDEMNVEVVRARTLIHRKR